VSFESNAKIDWYRCPIEPQVLAQLMQRSNLSGAIQTGLHLGWFFTTLSVCFLVFIQINSTNWFWMSPLFVLCLFVHGTMGPFMGLIAVHELQHKTVFKTRGLNSLFERVYAFISWSDCVWYQHSHAIHHHATCHVDFDGEVILPVKFRLKGRFWLGALAWDPKVTWTRLSTTWRHARGEISGDWHQHVLSSPEARRAHQRWAQCLLIGHTSLAVVFALTGNWILILLFTFGTQFCNWLGFLCGAAQHYGMHSDVPDWRANSRTFTCSPITAFYYWNMQYHVEHHMYPAVPFYNLGKLRKALGDDLPIVPHGLIATWKEILEIRKQALNQSTSS
jgi:fatty acid desaturase